MRSFERTPGGDPLGPHGDEGILLYPHPLVLVVLPAQKPYRGGVLLCARLEQPRPSTYHDEGQKAPVLCVAVGDQGDARVLEYVPNPLQARGWYILRLLVEGDVDRSLRAGEANRHHVRLPRPVGGREAGDAPPHEKCGLLGAKDLRGGLHAFTASRTLGATSEAKRRIDSSACSWVTPGRRAQKQNWS